MIFYTSDWHLGHARIPELAGRPFDDVDTMNAAILRNCNAMVDADDVLVMLGDLAMGRIADSLTLVEQIRAPIVLVPGNHDRVFPGYTQRASRILEWRERYTEVGCLVDDDPAPHELMPGVVARRSHFPYLGDHADHTEEVRFEEHRPIDDGAWLLCGHVHEAWQQRGRMINVGVDAWGGFPVPSPVLATLIVDGPADREVLPWRTP